MERNKKYTKWKKGFVKMLGKPQMECRASEDGTELVRYQENGADDVKIVSLAEDIMVIGDYSFSECRKIREVRLPKELKKIGRHAFYNCRGLEKLILPGKVEIEDGAFKNCVSLREIIFLDVIPQNTTIKYVLQEMSQDMQIEVKYKADLKRKEEKAKLFFPQFEYAYIANEPARNFSEVGYGAGYLYQQCFFQYDLDYKKYDEIFLSAVITEKLETLIKITINRLQYPYQLLGIYRERYIKWLKENWARIAEWFIKEEKKEIMKFLAALKEITIDEMEEAIMIANAEQKAECVIFLLDMKRLRFGEREKLFEL